MKKVLLTSALAVGAICTSQALDIYLTGATAFRGSLFNALNDPANWSGTLQKSPGASSSGSMFTFSGTWNRNDVGGIPQGTAVTIWCSFSGSVEGMKTLIDGSTQNFLDLNSNTVPHTCDLEFSDVFQNSTGLAPAISGKTLTDVAAKGVGVQPFVFAGNDNAVTNGIVNMTAQNFRAMGINGMLYKSQFVGGSDFSTLVYLTGRNSWSGTRTTTFSETGYGVFNAIQQMSHGNQVSAVNNGHSALNRNGDAAANAFPLNDGWESGGSVRADLQFNNGEYFIGYLSAGDARSIKASASASSANYLQYNGVPYTLQNVLAGKYTLWGYEHLYRLNNTATIQQAQISLFKAAAANLLTTYGADNWPGAIPLDVMGTVKRDTDGGTVVPF